MTSSKLRLPQLDGGWFLTDGGIETVLIYQDGVDLPEFAAFVLLDTADGRDILRRYYRRYLDIAVKADGAGFVLETPTWRAGIDWGAKLGFDAAAMQRINAEAVALITGCAPSTSRALQDRSSSVAASVRAATATRPARRWSRRMRAVRISFRPTLWPWREWTRSRPSR